jgi:hypothetical protein
MKSFYTFKTVALLLIFWFYYSNAYSQCTFGSQYLELEERNSEPATNTEDEELPANLLMNLNKISVFFNLKPSFRIYNDGNFSGAKTYCECQQAGCNTSTIFVGRKLITDYEKNSTFQDGFWGLIAHEVAHAYQCNLGITNITGVQRELHADFMAGFFLGRKTQFSLTSIKQFADELSRRGDFKFNDEQHHGTPEQRVRMMLTGASVNILTLEDASLYAYRMLTGQTNSYNIIGNWAPNRNLLNNSSERIYIFNQIRTLGFQPFNIQNGYATTGQTIAMGLGGNQYRITFPNGLVQDYFVIDNSKIIVIMSNGFVDIWLRM